MKRKPDPHICRYCGRLYDSYPKPRGLTLENEGLVAETIVTKGLLRAIKLTVELARCDLGEAKGWIMHSKAFRELQK